MRENSEINPYYQVRSSMSARIEFVLRSFPSSRHSSVASLDLPPPPPSLLAPPLPTSPPPPHSLNSSASSSHMSISMEDSRVVEEDDEFQYEEDECYENSGMGQPTTTPAPSLPTAGPPLPSRAPRPSGLGVGEVVDSQKIDQVQPTLEFQPQETSTPHTTPRKSFSKTIDRSMGPPPLMMSMDTDPDTSGEAVDDTIDEDPLYDSMVNENEPESPIAKKTDPINSAAKVKCPCDVYFDSSEMSNSSCQRCLACMQTTLVGFGGRRVCSRRTIGSGRSSMPAPSTSTPSQRTCRRRRRSSWVGPN